MDIAVILGALKDAHSLFIGDVAPLACLCAVSCEGADCYAQLLLQLAAALAHKAHCIAAGAVADAELTLVLLEPVGDMFDADRLICCGDGLLDGDNVHADAVASGRYHGRDLRQRQKCHALEELCDLGMCLDLLEVHVHKLCRTGNKDRQNVLAAAVGSIVVILQNALHRQGVHLLLNIGNALPHLRRDLLRSRGLAKIHRQRYVRLIVGDDARKAVVFGIGLGKLFKSELVRYAVGHFLAERNDFFSCHYVSPSIYIYVFYKSGLIS